MIVIPLYAALCSLSATKRTVVDQFYFCQKPLFPREGEGRESLWSHDYCTHHLIMQSEFDVWPGTLCSVFLGNPLKSNSASLHSGV